MKAFAVRSYGPPDHLDLTELPVPEPRAGEVLVQVRATSVNPYDWHGLRGEPRVARLMTPMLGLRAPKVAVPGCDAAGQVAAAGPDVTGLKTGDDVFALLPAGGFAEYTCVPRHLLTRMPPGLSYEQAAAVPMAAVTALLAVRDVARVQPGQSVLVHGASGGVGTFAVQLARAYGARVDAVCSSRNADLVRSLGAQEVIDYATQDFTRRGRRYDALIDIAGTRPALPCGRALTHAGTLVLVGGPAGRWVQPAGHVAASLATGMLMRQRVALADTVACQDKRQALDDLAALMADGTVTPVIARQYPFAQLPEAVAYQESGHAPGKVVVTVSAA